MTKVLKMNEPVVTGVGELWGCLALILNQPAWVLPSLLLLTFGVPPTKILTAILFRRWASV